MKLTNRLFAGALSAALAGLLGCQPAETPVVDPPLPATSAEPAETTGKPPAEEESESEADPDERGLDDDPTPRAAAAETPPPVVELPESLPTIDQLPALSSEAPIDEQTKLPFAQVGKFKLRDGVYVFRMDAAGGGSREIVMTVETQANGFAVQRGDRTRLRFVIDDQGVAFANEPGSGEIAGRGVASGDDWIRGAYRTKNDDGSTAEGTFELRKLFDPKTPRAPKQP
jgi:hypothetical protein